MIGVKSEKDVCSVLFLYRSTWFVLVKVISNIVYDVRRVEAVASCDAFSLLTSSDFSHAQTKTVRTTKGRVVARRQRITGRRQQQHQTPNSHA